MLIVEAAKVAENDLSWNDVRLTPMLGAGRRPALNCA